MPLDVLGRLPDARPIVFAALAETLVPPPRLKVSEWAEQHRIVSAESGSRYPGKWRNERAPYLVEVMDALGPEDPAEDVAFPASAQVGKSSVGENFFGFVVAQQPGPMIIVLPSHDEGAKYVRTKLQPMIDETRVLRARVLDVTTKGERGSTASFKRFRGGFAQITFAGSSKGLQMLSARYTIGEEVSEWPAAAGERGDPVAQLETRTKTYERDRKRLWVSTPGITGSCRITSKYEASDKKRYFVPCPHCGAYQVLRFEHLKWDSESWPHRAWFECAANGCVIHHTEKPEMVRRGRWIATAGEDDAPPLVFPAGDLQKWASRSVPTSIRGFHIWQAYSLFASWDSIVKEYLAARGGHERLRVFSQQVLGEAWEEKGDAPDAERLHAARVAEFRRGEPPVGPVVFTGATDAQGNRLEWAVWGWSEGMTRWLVDWGVIPGDPSDPATWAEMARIIHGRQYAPGGGGRSVGVDLWAVDSGYMSHAVYNFVRGRPGVHAVDGRDGRTEPMVGTPKKVDIKFNGKRVPKGAVLWPVGSFSLKSDLYGAIRKTIDGPIDGVWQPGAAILPADADLAYCEQLTSEFLKEVEARSGVIVRRWEKLQGRPNEALDIACYARAMAYHLRLDRMTPEQWAALREERFGDDAGPQGDLFAVPVAPAPIVSHAPPSRAPATTDPGATVGETKTRGPNRAKSKPRPFIGAQKKGFFAP